MQRMILTRKGVLKTNTVMAMASGTTNWGHPPIYVAGSPPPAAASATILTTTTTTATLLLLYHPYLPLYTTLPLPNPGCPTALPIAAAAAAAAQATEPAVRAPAKAHYTAHPTNTTNDSPHYFTSSPFRLQLRLLLTAGRYLAFCTTPHYVSKPEPVAPQTTYHGGSCFSHLNPWEHRALLVHGTLRNHHVLGPKVQSNRAQAPIAVRYPSTPSRP